MLAEANSTDTEDPAGKPAVDLGAQSRLMQVPRSEICLEPSAYRLGRKLVCSLAGGCAVQAASIAEPC